MRIERKIFRLQMFGGLVVGEIIEQNGAKNRTFRFHVCGQRVREAVVGDGQSFIFCLLKYFLERAR